ncbi:hypothetical protein [Companilactobacillus sp. HBUAS59544]|uniref:hypothetical protein n=1 Tax=Companilactobacillus sp. HBUAS59544 TaxID=3109363 RepID=UPI002FEF09F9
MAFIEYYFGLIVMIVTILTWRWIVYLMMDIPKGSSPRQVKIGKICRYIMLFSGYFFIVCWMFMTA